MVRPVDRPDVEPRAIERVETDYGDDFQTPLPEPLYVVAGHRHRADQLEPVTADEDAPTPEPEA